MSSYNEWKEKAVKFIEYLQKFKSNKRVMSDLRKGLSKTLAHKSYRYLVQWCNLDIERMRIITQSIAAFFAIYPNHSPGMNFGRTFRVFALKRNLSESPEKRIENYGKYMERLLACRDSETLCDRLSFMIRMIKNYDVSIDYVSLYMDVLYWGERSKIQWATGYYDKGKEEEDVSD